MTPVIEFRDYTFRYKFQKEPTLHDINLKIYPGEKVLITGPSSSGKSVFYAYDKCPYSLLSSGMLIKQGLREPLYLSAIFRNRSNTVNSVSGQCQVRSVSGQCQASVRSVSGQCQVSVRPVSGQCHSERSEESYLQPPDIPVILRNSPVAGEETRVGDVNEHHPSPLLPVLIVRDYLILCLDIVLQV